MCSKGPKVGPFRSLFAPILVTRVSQIDYKATYRVVKRNCQVVRFVDFGQMNEFMVQNSSPTCQHNLFTLIQIKKMFLKYLAMLKSSKRLRVSDLPCANSSKTAKFLRSMQPLPNGIS